MRRALIAYLLGCVLCVALANQQPSEEHPAEHQEHGHHIPGAGLSIVFIFGGMLYSGILKAMCDKANIPINPLLLITGIILGNYYEHLGLIGQATKLISELNPNGLLAIFLPTLIFESAFKSQWYMLKKQIGQTLILGVPCVILASFLIMAAIKLLIGYGNEDYNWREAFLLACTLCCTDIFSFIAKLRQYGTPQMLISLIEGESLFNYCTCVLIFQITNEILIGYGDHSLLEIAPLFMMETFGGILFGLAFGFIALFFIKRINYNGVLVVTIMIIFSYTIYMVMEFTVIKVSGIISLVTFGIFMGAFGKAHIVGDSALAMQSFWSYAVFIAESSIFLIAGVLVGVNVLNIENVFNVHMLSLFQIYVVVLVARYLSILIFQPRLSNLGYGLQWKQSLVIAYGGLKGAIGISFAIIVFQDQSYSENTRNLFLMHVTANSLFTLLINGMTTGWVINWLKLSNLTKIEYKFFKEYIQTFKEKVEDKKNDMIGEKYLNTVDWDEIDKKIGIDELKKLQTDIDVIINKNNLNSSSRFEKQQVYYLENTLQEVAANRGQNVNGEKDYELQNLKFQIIVEIRKRFIKNLKYKYWVYHQEHNTMPDAVMLLLQSANVDLDCETESIESWAWIKNQISYNIRFASELRKSYFFGAWAREYLFNYISYCYDVVSSYIQANEQARQQFKEIKFGGVNDEAVKLLLRESEENQKQAEDYLYNELKPSFPEIEQEVVTRKASFNLLLSFRNIIDSYNQSGQLDTSEYELLSNLINKKRMALQLHNPQWKKTNLLQQFKQDKVFSLLPDKVLAVLEEKLSTAESYNSREIIQANGSICKHLYFIRRGGCGIELINGNISYKETMITGDFYGWESLLSNTHRSTITTNTWVTIVSIRKSYISRIMDCFSDFEEAFWKHSMFYLLKLFESGQNISIFMSHLEKEHLNEALESFKLKRLDEGQHTISEDCIFLRGSCIIQSEQQGSEGQKAEPLTFFHDYESTRVKLLEKTSFLVGKFPVPSEEESKFIASASLAPKKREKVTNKRSFQSQYRPEQHRRMQQL